MEFIDKSRGQQQAHTLLNAFLLRCRDESFNTSEDLYEKMGSGRDLSDPTAENTKVILKRQLLQENNGRCCYCMRSIDENNTTLEHIIPNKIPSQKEYDLYQPFFPKHIWQNMVFAGYFLSNPRWPFRAYPHTIAYENLIPSCDGKFARSSSPTLHSRDDRESKCCNNKRGSKFVIPFVLNQQMVSEIKYKSDGYVVWPVTDNSIQGEERKRLLLIHKNTIDNLNLNCPELVAIRRIWFFLTSLGQDCTKDNQGRTILFLTEDPSLSLEEEEMLKNFWSDNYWCLLEEYRYFNDRNKFV